MKLGVPVTKKVERTVSQLPDCRAFRMALPTEGPSTFPLFAVWVTWLYIPHWDVISDFSLMFEVISTEYE
jgi:hypothetical protein